MKENNQRYNYLLAHKASLRKKADELFREAQKERDSFICSAFSIFNPDLMHVDSYKRYVDLCCRFLKEKRLEEDAKNEIEDIEISWSEGRG